MAWTTPRTWVTSEVVTASIMNTHVRDNFNETAPAVAATVGSFIGVDGSNSLAERNIGGGASDAEETTTSVTFTDLATSGPATTVTTGTRALVMLTARIRNSSGGALSYVGYAVSGATTASATDLRALEVESSAASDTYTASAVFLHSGLTAGNNTFTCKYRTSTGTATYRRRGITVYPG